jgi:8-oxo-dGTP diphosphatase
MAHRIKAAALWGFGRLPLAVKVQLVRAGSPSFTVGSMVCIERGDSIVLTRSPHKTGWSLPGGLLKRREAPADTARREITEELGVTVILEGSPAYVLDAATQRCDVVFVGRLLEGQEPTAASYEVSECRWFDRAHLPVLHSHSVKALEALAALRESKR